jgi:hypothetical protein
MNKKSLLELDSGSVITFCEKCTLVTGLAYKKSHKINSKIVIRTAVSLSVCHCQSLPPEANISIPSQSN